MADDILVFNLGDQQLKSYHVYVLSPCFAPKGYSPHPCKLQESNQRFAKALCQLELTVIIVIVDATAVIEIVSVVFWCL